MISILKRSGRTEILDITKIQKMTSESTFGIPGVSQSVLELDAQIKFIDGMSSSAIQDSLIKTAVEKIDIDVPGWTFVAARLFIFDLYHRVGMTTHGDKGTAYCHLSDYLKYGKDAGRLLPALGNHFDLEKLNAAIKPERDMLFNYLGIKTLYDRYLIKDKNKEPIELPQHMFMAIAMFLAQKEDPILMNDIAIQFYDVISKFEVMLATPTLSNARTNRHQLSSCFLEGTEVQLLDGLKPIDKIMVGDLALTHDGTYKRIIELFERDFASSLYTLGIQGLNEDLVATEEHPIHSLKLEDIACYRGTKKKSQGLCINHQSQKSICFKQDKNYRKDCICLDKVFKEPEFRAIKMLNVGDFVSIGFPTFVNDIKWFSINDIIGLDGMVEDNGWLMVKNSPHDNRLNFRPVINESIKKVKNIINIDKDFMLMVGYFMAEGHIAKNMLSICFTFGSKEKDYQKFVVDYFEQNFGVKSTIQQNKDNSTNIIISSKIIAALFLELCGTGFNTKYLRDILMFAEPKLQKYILIGAIRGDGCSVANGYQLALTNKRLINQLFQIALRNKMVPHMYNPYQGELATEPAYTLIISKADKEFCFEVDKNISKINFEGEINNYSRFWHGDYYFMKIKSNDAKFHSSKVYNIEVEENHSYVVNNVNVHNCYIGSSPDNIEGIFDGYKEMALLSKFGGGIGWDWNQIRALGGVIDDHKSAAGGTVPFLKITNDIAIAVDQLGTRKGAIAVYLEPWHMDIIDFIDLKKNSGEERRRAHDLFPALWISDIFMERVLEDGHWTLFDPYEVKDLSECHGDEFKAKYIAYENDPSITKNTMKAKDLWKKVLTSYFESGSPFLCFKDTANRANPNSHVGHIRSSNLCTEIFQNTNPDKYWVKLWVTTVEDKDETNKETEAIDHPLLEKQNVGGDIIDSEVYYLVQEDDILMLEDGSYKKGNKVTSLDVLRGIVDKVKTLEEPANIEKIKNGETSLNFVVEMFENRLAVFNVEKEKIDGNTAVCNLASVNLSRINTIKDIERVVPIAVRMLDNVIDLNFYPLKKVKVTNMRSRSIGLGVMGEAEMLAVSKIHFGSQEHRNKIDQIMEAISYNTIRSSMELALEKSPYPDFNGSKWSKGIFPMDHATDETNDLTSRALHYDWETLKDEVRWNGVRNGYMMAIAPTSSISILVGTTQAIEPAYKRKWFEENLSGLIPVVVPHLSPETWNYYTPAFEIDQLNIIKAAAIRQKWIDQGQSTNIFMNLDKASGKHLHEIYVLAWKLGLKSTYYLRSQSPEAKNDVEDRSMECSGCQ